MPVLSTMNLSLQYEVYGSENCETLLLIQGLGMQLTDWPEPLIAALASQFRVVVFDNRDVGLSARIVPPAGFEAVYASHQMFDAPRDYRAYTLYDMAADALGVMNALSIGQFHVLGFSMGGMIAQVLTALHPDRVVSLVSLMSSGGEAEMISTPAALEKMNLSARHFTADKAVDLLIAGCEVYAGSYAPLNPEAVRRWAESSVKRSYCPEGIYRQGLAVQATGARQHLLKTIRVPSLIIHGDEDPCIHWTQGRHAHALIKGSAFWLVKGLGHDFPDRFVPCLAKKLDDFWAGEITR